MVITDKIFVTDPLQENIVAGGGQFITYPQVSKEQAVVQIETHLRNQTDKITKLQLLSQLCDSTGKVVAKVITPITLEGQSALSIE